MLMFFNVIFRAKANFFSEYYNLLSSEEMRFINFKWEDCKDPILLSRCSGLDCGNIEFLEKNGEQVVDLLIYPEVHTKYDGKHIWKKLYPLIDTKIDKKLLNSILCSINIHKLYYYENKGVEYKNLNELDKSYTKNYLLYPNFKPKFYEDLRYIFMYYLKIMQLIPIKNILELSKSNQNIIKKITKFSNRYDCPEINKIVKNSHNLGFHRNFKEMQSILNCIGCGRCKLWGTIQFTGLNVSIKLLNNEDVTKNEIIYLVNAYGRVINSVRIYLEIHKKCENKMFLLLCYLKNHYRSLFILITLIMLVLYIKYKYTLS